MTALPASLAGLTRRRILDDADQGLGTSRGAHISIRGNRFRLIDGAGNEKLVETTYLDVVVCDANPNTSKVYFAGEYNPSNPSDDPPACWSDNGTGPSKDALSPQSPTCTVCPWNDRNSATSKLTGKGIKACSDRKKIGVVLPDAPDVVVYELQIPPGSLTNLRAYNKWINQQATGGRALDLADLVTRIEFDPDKTGVMLFKPAGWADDDRTIQLLQYIETNNLGAAAVGRNDVALDPARFALPAKTVPYEQIAAPVAPQAPPQQFALPPRQAAAPPAVLPAPVAPPASPEAPRQKRRAATPSPAQEAQVAPFMAAAQENTVAGRPVLQHTPMPMMGGNANAQIPAIPEFLRRDGQAGPRQDASVPPTPQFGMGAGAPPPPDVAQALQSAMSLPTRR